MTAPALFRRVFLAALLAGLCAGVLAFALRHAITTPMILAAEALEHAALPAGHGHDEGWKPADGLERGLFTLLAETLSAIAFALLLGGGMVASGRVPGWMGGLAWGAAGFVVFSLAPAFGLPPELPGGGGAALAARQAWWLLTVVLTGGAIALIACARGAWAWAVAAALAVLPHLIGAPAAAGEAQVPAELARAFVLAVLAINAVFWLALGAASGFFQRRLLGRG